MEIEMSRRVLTMKAAWLLCEALSLTFALMGIAGIVHGELSPLGLLFCIPVAALAVREHLKDQSHDQ